MILLALAGTARADVCDDPRDDPSPVAIRDGGFDATRSACLRGAFELRTDAHALIDTPDFYGTLGGDLDLGVAFVETPAFAWGARVRLADVTFAQTAVTTATELRYGPASVHAAVRSVRSPDVHVAGVVAVELPFTREDVESTRAGGQLAGLVSWRAADRVTVHGRLAALGWFGQSALGTSTRVAGVASVDAAVRLGGVRVLGGVEASAGWYRGGLDHVAARLGARWRLGGAWRMDAGVVVPVAGDERLDLGFTLGVTRDR